MAASEVEHEESALLLRCPAAEPVVGSSRARLDRAAAVGVPAHLTVTYPFRPPALLTEEDHGGRAVVGSGPVVGQGTVAPRALLPVALMDTSGRQPAP